MNRKSFIRMAVFIMITQVVLIAGIFLAFLISTYQTAMREMEDTAENFLEVLGTEMENRLNNTNMILEGLLYKNTNYDLLESGSERERFYAAHELHEQMNQAITFTAYIDAIVVAEKKYQICLDQENINLTHDMRSALREYTLSSAGREIRRAKWSIDLIGDVPYINKIRVWNGQATGVYISVDSMMKAIAAVGFEKANVFLTDGEGRIYGSYGENSGQYKIGENIRIASNRYVLEKEYDLDERNLRIFYQVKSLQLGNQIRMGVILLFSLILTSLFTEVFLIGVLRTELISPMRQVKEKMIQIQKGDYELRLTQEYHTQEFSMLKDTFNQLMDEILGLKMKSYLRQIEQQESELRCIKLQIRPHFFLNALTTISSLSIQGRDQEIQTYIAALTKNIRYMFKSGLHTVPLEEELRHAENYFEMQDLKYPGCVFYSIEAEEGTKEWKIPQMIIHTIIENEYKYAIKLDQILTILMKAEIVEKDGEKLLHLLIEDDGAGYSEEAIANFAQRDKNKEGMQLGLWSIERMLELMYEREGLFSISNIEPHGCFNEFWVPKEPVHELGKILAD